MTRGYSRFLAFLGVVVLGVPLMVIITSPKVGSGDKIFFGSLFALFILLIKDVMNGKVWDYAHRGDKKEKTKDS